MEESGRGENEIFEACAKNKSERHVTLLNRMEKVSNELASESEA